MEGGMTAVTIYQPQKTSGVEESMMGGAMLSTTGGMLDLDHSLHHPSALHHQQTLPHHLEGLAPLSTTQHLSMCQDSEPGLKLDCKSNPKSTFICSKGKSGGTSDEDEPSFTEDGDFQHCGKGKKSSPWQRVKWTDAMIKLLIKVVLFVGEDGTAESGEGNKRKSGLLQKKGKWKSVSSLMNESGCYVSPQQCEDKFNDLNKRYKRLNDILGRETALAVVDNPSLLDSLENLPSKVKDDVKKLLSSKHLFYREMCSYHSGCKSIVSPDLEFRPSIQAELLAKSRDGTDNTRHVHAENDVEEDEEDDVEEDEDEEDCDDLDDENGTETPMEATNNLSYPFSKKRKMLGCPEGLHGRVSDYSKNISLEPLSMSFTSMMQDGAHLTAEQCQLLQTRLLQLEERKVSLQAQALELEKQRFKWQKFSSRKDAELERLKEENKKMKLENARISFQLKQKELEMECKRSVASMTSLDLIVERLQAKEQIQSGRAQGY